MRGESSQRAPRSLTPVWHNFRVKLATAVVAVMLAAACASTARASSGLLLGITDSGSAYYDEPDSFYPTLGQLGAQVLRVQLNWGGPLGVAGKRPAEPDDPN